ncbi:MAG: hypothetical protein E7262_06890 [Lachnospiraceae bacterium]|nr:hypothetical protein [Lachnospiraceae bacterium]
MNTENNQITNKNIRKRRCMVCIIILLLITLVKGGQYARDEYKRYKSSIKTKFFKCEELKYVEDICKTKEQTIKIDDYTITLKKVIFDAATERGFAKLEFMINNGEFSKEFDRYEGWNNEPIADRFVIQEADRFETYIEKNVLHAYVEFEMREYTNKKYLTLVEQPYLYDYNAEREHTYKFEIAQDSNAKVYVLDENLRIAISPLCIQVDRLYNVKDVNYVYNEEGDLTEIDEINGNNDLSVSIMYNNKVKKKVISSLEGCGSSSSSGDDMLRCRYVNDFCTYKDTDNIDYIIVNGKKYTERDKELRYIYDYKKNYFNKDAIKKYTDLYTDKKQVLTIDDYTITLEKHIYDFCAKQGVAYMSFKKKAGDIEANIDMWHRLIDEIDNRFDLEYAFDSEAYIEDGVLYVLVEFDLYGEDTNKLGIIDYNQIVDPDNEDGDIYKIHHFKLNSDTPIAEFKVDENTKITISPFSTQISLNNGDKYKDIEIVAYDKKGNKTVLMKSNTNNVDGRFGVDTSIPSYYEYEEWLEVKDDKITYKNENKDIINIEDIEYITCLGKKVQNKQH